MKITMKLTKKAAKQGGDRYEAQVKNQDFVVYFPQVISRPNGEVLETLTMELN